MTALLSPLLLICVVRCPRSTLIFLLLPTRTPVLSPPSWGTCHPSSLDDAIIAAFETYALFEQASGSKLNQSKSKGLWLGGWCGRVDPSVASDWSSSKLKVLGVFIGVGDLEADNWCPRIDAVERVLNSWHSRSLSFCGKALVVNALALSRVWYVASLVDMPPWVLKELSSLALCFF